MNEERGIKNILMIVLVLIIVGLLFVLFDIVKNDSAIVDSAIDVVTSSEEEAEEVEDIPTPKNTFVPKKATSPISTAKPSEAIVTDPGITIVTYSDSGFIPPVVEVTAGDSVTFINSSSKPMWVTSEDHPTAKAQLYRGFDQGKSVPSGGTYNFSFLKVGVWGYKNLNADSHLGAVSVIPQ